MPDWHGVLLVLGRESGDGRLVESITWRDLPIPLLGIESHGLGHDGALIIGTVDRVWIDSDLVRGEGSLVPQTDLLVDDRLSAGFVPGGADLDQAVIDDDQAEGLTFVSGRLSAFTVYLGGRHQPAWPETGIERGPYID